MTKKPAKNNRTLLLSAEEQRCYAMQCAGPQQAAKPLDQVFCGDLFAIAPLLPVAFVDLLVVDPPYNLTKQYGVSTFHAMERQAYDAFTRRWMDAVRHTLKPDASIYVCCDWRSSLSVAPALAERFRLQNRITWQRDKGRSSGVNWKNAMEDIWFATVGNQYYFDAAAVRQRRRVLAPYRKDGTPKDWCETEQGRFRDTGASNFWDDITVPYWSMPENTEHPAQKPEKLMAKLLLASCPQGGVVLDPFGGTGASAVVAKKLERRFVLIEQEEAFCALCQKRLAQCRPGDPIQGYQDGVFWERNSAPTR